MAYHQQFSTISINSLPQNNSQNHEQNFFLHYISHLIKRTYNLYTILEFSEQTKYINVHRPRFIFFRNKTSQRDTVDHEFWVKVYDRNSWGSSNWINVTLTGKGILLYGLVRVSFKGGFKSSVGEFRSLSKLKPNVRMCLAASAHHLLTSWRLSCATTFGLSLIVEVASCRKWFWWRGQELRVEVSVWTFPDERFPRWVTRRRMEAWVGAAIRSNSSRLLFGLANIGLSEVGCCCISGFFRCWRPLWDFLLSLETPHSPNRPRVSAMLIMYLAFSLTISCTVDMLHVKEFGQM